MVHQAFTYSTIGLAVMLLGLGMNAILRPDAHLASLEFPVYSPKSTMDSKATDSQTQLRKLSHALMRIWGVRNITFGTILAFIWVNGNPELMGKAISVSILLPLMDGWVSRKLIGGGELQHWIFPPILGFVAAGLFGYFG